MHAARPLPLAVLSHDVISLDYQVAVALVSGLSARVSRSIEVSRVTMLSEPIEQVFSKLKHLLLKAEARSQAAVCRAIGVLLSTYSAEECANYFRSLGYDRS
jgi:hypothetical protein